MTKTLNNLVFLSKDNDWFWDNDENGMTYFIYDREHNLHDTPEEKRYQIIMTPQSEIGNILKINLIPENSACVLESDDCECMNSWANNMSDGLFPSTPVPEFIIQNEAIKQFINSISSSHMTESDTVYLYEKALKSYHITKDDFEEYKTNIALDEDLDPKYENAEKFMEGVANIASNVGIGGIIAALVKFLPGPVAKIVGGSAAAIASAVAKGMVAYQNTVKSEEYKNLVAEGNSKDAGKMVKKEVGKQVGQALAAAGIGGAVGALLNNTSSNFISKMFKGKGEKQIEKAVSDVTTEVSNPTAMKTDLQKALGNGMPSDIQDKMAAAANVKPQIAEVPQLPSIDKMNAEQLGNIGPNEYKDFLSKNPKDGLQTLLKNPAIVNNPNELAELYKSGAFEGMSYGDMGTLRTAIKNNGGDATQFQGMLNAMVSPDLKGAKQFADLGVGQNINMIKSAGADSFLTNQYVPKEATAVFNNAANHGFDTSTVKTQVGQDNFLKSMGMGSNANGTYNVTNSMAGDVTGTFNPATNTLSYSNAANGLTGTFDTNGNVATTAKGLQRRVGTDGTISYVDAKGNPLSMDKGMKQFNKQNTQAAKTIAKAASKQQQ